MSKKRGSSQKTAGVVQRQYYKTIEDEETVVSLKRESQLAKDYKGFMDGPHH